jgi:hypothetical protein
MLKLTFAVNGYIFRRRQYCLSRNCLTTIPKRRQKEIPYNSNKSTN